MKKRLLCLVLALGVCLGSVSAAGEELFPAVNAYPGYADVKETDWFYENARLCNEVGLMNGTDKGFEPEKTLTVAECAAVASRIRAVLTGEAIPSGTPLAGQTRPWYQDYLDYMRSADATLTPMLTHPEESCSRMQYLRLLNAALPSERGLLSAINSITSLPDTDSGTVLAFYNAGILTGVDEYGTFDGDKSLTRAECAAMVSRIVRPELRKSFVPQEKSSPAGAGEDPNAEDDSPAVLKINDRVLTLFDFAPYLLDEISMADYSLRQRGDQLDWNADYGVGDLKEYFIDQALDSAIRATVLEEQAKNLGCKIEDIPAALSPSPSYEALSSYAAGQDLLCAKHILVENVDTAQAALNALATAPTPETFNALIEKYGTDPGMTANPDGYLFSAGEMVSEFENGTRALAIGSYTTEPVRSQYGYHIIWRLDPATHPDLLEPYQINQALHQLEHVWLAQAQVAVDPEALDILDPQALYEAYSSAYSN